MTWVRPPLNPTLPDSVPVFPLPEVVLFPGTVLPLHVFEPRYRKLVRDARETEGIIALALLKPGWEPEYYGSPEVHRLGCAGRIIEVQDFPDGRYNIKLAGLCRALFVSFESEEPYRVARVRAVPERVPVETDPRVAQAKSELVCAYAQLVATITDQPATGLEGAVSVPLHPLVNTVCAHIDLPVAAKQRLLRMDNVLERCLAITRILREQRERLRGRRPRGGGPGASGDSDLTVH